MYGLDRGALAVTLLVDTGSSEASWGWSYGLCGVAMWTFIVGGVLAAALARRAVALVVR